MMMNTAIAQLVMFGTPDILKRVGGFLRASGGMWSTVQPIVVTDIEQILEYAKKAEDELVIALVAAQHADVTLNSWLDQANKFSNLAVVMLSDAADVHDAGILRGQPVVLAIRDMSPQLLHDSLRVALEFQHLKRQQRGIQQHFDLAEARFRDMAELFADWLWELDSQLRLTFSSTRKRPAQGATKGSMFIDGFLPEEKLRIEDDFAELMQSPRPFHDRDYWSADPYGSRICWSVSGVPIQGAKGELLGFRGIARDISSIKASTDQIYYLVNHDSLTGVMNRQRCQDELIRTLRSAKREKRTGALLMIDIDRFGYVNQTYGHLVGDKLLIHFAQILKDNVRTGDLVARLDGDQFAVMLRDVRPEDLDSRLERLQSAIASRPMPTEQATITVSVSAGVAVYPQDAETPDDLLAKASDALGVAKKRGPRRFERFDATNATAKTTGGQMEWVEMLNECLTNHETRLVLYYQPIVPLVGPALKEKNEHYEVLLRLADRDGNILAPSKFIETAEEFGLIAKIDHLVTTRAIDMLKVWHEQGRQVHLSINLSGKTFDNHNFLATIKQYLQEANLPKKALVFEITETALLRDLQLVKKFMTEMREVGAGFALDDCGVGYSSFNYIRQLELDYIKIDGSFIKNLHLNNDDQAFVKALADVARQKNISTVAEMVEHEGAMIALQQLGIDFGQGYFFAAPAAELPVPGWAKKFVN